jgi:cytochrome oxidase assembly protein ShyY1
MIVDMLPILVFATVFTVAWGLAEWDLERLRRRMYTLNREERLENEH